MRLSPIVRRHPETRTQAARRKASRLAVRVAGWAARAADLWRRFRWWCAWQWLRLRVKTRRLVRRVTGKGRAKRGAGR